MGREVDHVVDWAGCAIDGASKHGLYGAQLINADIWISLARIADATERIGLGTGVAVPSMRHPMATASAIAAVEALAPGRLVVAFGTGFPARVTMGQKPMTWKALTEYTRQVRKLTTNIVHTLCRHASRASGGRAACLQPILSSR